MAGNVVTPEAVCGQQERSATERPAVRFHFPPPWPCCALSMNCVFYCPLS